MRQALWRLIQQQKGYATLTLALIAVLFTTLLVIPFLVQVQTALLAVRAADRGLSGQSCGTAGVEDALWKLQLPDDDPDFASDPQPYSIDCDGQSVSVAVTLVSQSSSPPYLSDYVYADIVLAMDVSGSISTWGSPSEMDLMKQAAHEIMDAFNLYENSDRYRIGISRFRGSSASVAAMTDVDDPLTDPPEDHHDGVPLHDGINGLNGDDLGNGTNLVQGIQGGAAQFDTGLGDRPDVPNLMVFLTDGDDSHGNGMASIENASANSGAQIFAVGIEDEGIPQFDEVLDAIATDPNEEHVFHASDFQVLLDLIDEIVAAVTEAGVAGSIYDIEVTAPDGSIILVRALLTLDGEIVIISSQ